MTSPLAPRLGSALSLLATLAAGAACHPTRAPVAGGPPTFPADQGFADEPLEAFLGLAAGPAAAAAELSAEAQARAQASAKRFTSELGLEGAPGASVVGTWRDARGTFHAIAMVPLRAITSADVTEELRTRFRTFAAREAGRPTWPAPPPWVIAGSGVRGSVGHGVASAGGIKNVSLLRATADGRAKSELSRLVAEIESRLMRRFVQERRADGWGPRDGCGDLGGTGGSDLARGPGWPLGQRLACTVRALRLGSGSGVEIAARYLGEDGELHALATVELLAAMTAGIEAAEGPSPEERETLKRILPEVLREQANAPEPAPEPGQRE